MPVLGIPDFRKSGGTPESHGPHLRVGHDYQKSCLTVSES